MVYKEARRGASVLRYPSPGQFEFTIVAIWFYETTDPRAAALMPGFIIYIYTFSRPLIKLWKAATRVWTRSFSAGCRVDTPKFFDPQTRGRINDRSSLKLGKLFSLEWLYVSKNSTVSAWCPLISYFTVFSRCGNAGGGFFLPWNFTVRDCIVIKRNMKLAVALKKKFKFLSRKIKRLFSCKL